MCAVRLPTPNTNKTGLFQAASGGTLFLDEIGEMPVALQAKLLTVIESKRVRPLGATAEVTVDVRVVAATNSRPSKPPSLERDASGSDLYYPTASDRPWQCLPPLRDASAEDLPLLAASIFSPAHGAGAGNRHRPSKSRPRRSERA